MWMSFLETKMIEKKEWESNFEPPQEKNTVPQEIAVLIEALGILAHLLRMVLKPKYTLRFGGDFEHRLLIIWRSVSQDP